MYMHIQILRHIKLTIDILNLGEVITEVIRVFWGHGTIICGGGSCQRKRQGKVIVEAATVTTIMILKSLEQSLEPSN